MAAPLHSSPFHAYVYQNPQASVIPFQILGGEAQIVQIMLRSQEKITAKSGSLCFMSESILMVNIYPPEHEGGIWQWLFGKSATTIVFFNSGPGNGFVGIAAPAVSRILPIDLANIGGEILCQPDAFLCSINDVTITNSVAQRAQNIVSNAEGVLRQKLVGQGLAFLVSGGSVLQKSLDAGEVLVVDAACVLAITSTVDFQIKNSINMRRLIFGGDSPLTSTLTGPGIVFMQSLPLHRLSGRIARAITSPNTRENPNFFIQIAILFFLAYALIFSCLLLVDK